jgi:hypothetical protein
MLVILCVAGCGLWLLHADAWSLGRRSPVLNYDTSQYAIAARELADHGRFGTTFALPLELATHPNPPWPLAVVQPGLVVLEAAIFRIAPRELRIGGRVLGQWTRPDQIEWLVVPIGFTCFLILGASLALATGKLLWHYAPSVSDAERMAAGSVVGLAFLLDPEAQHFAVGGFTELPFTYGFVGALAMLALGHAPRRPLLFGLLLGVTGSFRANMVWLGPMLALAAAAIAPRGGRMRVLAFAFAGLALPLVPWWIYKWRSFGNPGWDLTRFVLWDGVGGRTWFSLFHLPELPRVPTGAAAIGPIAGKAARNLPGLAIAMMTGPRALWIGALGLWLLVADAPRALRVTALAVLACLAVSAALAAASIPWLRFVFPARAPAEAAGILATWGLLSRLPAAVTGPASRRVLRASIAALALGWGAWQTTIGNREAAETSQERGVPSTVVLLKLAVLMNREIPPGEAVMSNLGPTLAWHARRPVIHLALEPEDLDACRRRLDVSHVLLVFRKPEYAWGGWRDIVARPLEARQRPELNIRRVREFISGDGFRVVWLDLGPLPARLASADPPTTTGGPMCGPPVARIPAFAKLAYRSIATLRMNVSPSAPTRTR